MTKMQYVRAIDMMLAAASFQAKGDFDKAAKYLQAAVTDKSFKLAEAQLSALQSKLLERARVEQASARTTPLAKALEAAAAKKKVKAKKPMPTKKGKKKVKADLGDDAFNQTLDQMTEEADDDDMDLDLVDIEETIGDDTNELPVASEGEEEPSPNLDGEGLMNDDMDEVVSESEDDESDDEEGDDEPAEEDAEADEDGDDEGDDEGEEDSEEEAKPTVAKKQTAKPAATVAQKLPVSKQRVNRATANIAALQRLAQTGRQGKK